MLFPVMTSGVSSPSAVDAAPSDAAVDDMKICCCRCVAVIVERLDEEDLDTVNAEMLLTLKVSNANDDNTKRMVEKVCVFVI